eukprot:Sspe_Gene.58810::Locus_32291_Transcript_1_1_Confidence_1.000_Length_825::g.58810::m.58810
MSFTHEPLGEGLWKVVQEDRFGQYPFLYVLHGKDKVIVIDTGCPLDTGKTQYVEYLDTHLNPAKLPYTVICTHVHFDHVGGNRGFAGAPILMGGGAKSFTGNVSINSLCAAHSTTVPDFEVTRWLEEGDMVYFDDSDPTDGLEVLFTPGHTPDSISLYSRKHKRIFIGDLLYPFTV